MDFTAPELTAAFGGLLAGGLVKGIIGVALPIAGIAITILVLDPLTALGVMVLPLILTNGWQALQGGLEGLREPWRRFWPIVLTASTTISVVALFAARLPGDLILALVGVTLILFVVANLVSDRLHVPARLERRVGLGVGVVSGVLGGATTVFGPPINMFFITLRLEREFWMRSVGLTYLACSLPLFAGYVANGILDGRTTMLSAMSCVPALVGLQLGTWLRRRIPQDRFRRILLVVLALMGLNLLRRAIV